MNVHINSMTQHPIQLEFPPFPLYQIPVPNPVPKSRSQIRAFHLDPPLARRMFAGYSLDVRQCPPDDRQMSDGYPADIW